jgi:predicted nucleic acid-binding protein
MMIDMLIDTNVWIYAMDKSSVYHQPAKTILTNPNYNLFITAKNISEFFAVTSKLKIAHQSCLDFFGEIKINTNIIFPSENSLLIFEKLIQQYQPKGNQVFDIEIVSIMLDNEINHIATFNQKDFINITEIQILEF